MGFGVWGLGFGVWGLGFGVWGLGFGVWGLGVQSGYPPPPPPTLGSTGHVEISALSVSFNSISHLITLANTVPSHPRMGPMPLKHIPRNDPLAGLIIGFIRFNRFIGFTGFWVRS